MWIDCQAIMDRTGYTAVYEEDLTDTQKTMLRTSLVKFWSTLFDPSEITFIKVSPSGLSLFFQLGAFDYQVKLNPNTGKPIKSTLREVRTGSKSYK